MQEERTLRGNNTIFGIYNVCGQANHLALGSYEKPGPSKIQIIAQRMLCPFRDRIPVYSGLEKETFRGFSAVVMSPMLVAGLKRYLPSYPGTS